MAEVRFVIRTPNGVKTVNKREWLKNYHRFTETRIEGVKFPTPEDRRLKIVVVGVMEV